MNILYGNNQPKKRLYENFLDDINPKIVREIPEDERLPEDLPPDDADELAEGYMLKESPESDKEIEQIYHDMSQVLNNQKQMMGALKNISDYVDDSKTSMGSKYEDLNGSSYLEYLTEDENEEEPSEETQEKTDGSNIDNEAELKQFLSGLSIEDIGKELNELLRGNDGKKIKKFLKGITGPNATQNPGLELKKAIIPVENLHPTQNEIGLGNSLKYVLDDGLADGLFSGKVEIAGKPIVTYNGNKIIDGHHRWSQVFLSNPQAKMVCYNFTGPEMGAEDILKITQTAIAATKGTVPSEDNKTTNIYNCSPEDVFNYVMDNCSDKCIQSFRDNKDNLVNAAGKKINLTGKDNKSDKKAIAYFIAKNSTKLPKPAEGAPDRKFMPQTDSSVISNMAKGQETLKAEALRRASRKRPLKEWSEDLDEINEAKTADPSALGAELEEIKQDLEDFGPEGFYGVKFSNFLKEFPAFGKEVILSWIKEMDIRSPEEMEDTDTLEDDWAAGELIIPEDWPCLIDGATRMVNGRGPDKSKHWILWDKIWKTHYKAYDESLKESNESNIELKAKLQIVNALDNKGYTNLARIFFYEIDIKLTEKGLPVVIQGLSPLIKKYEPSSLQPYKGAKKITAYINKNYSLDEIIKAIIKKESELYKCYRKVYGESLKESVDDIEYIAVSDTDANNENESFDTLEDAIKYAKENGLDGVLEVNHITGTEESVWENDGSLKEDTIKQNGKWVNKGKEGTHGKFDTKEKADAQRNAMFARGFKK